MIAKEPISKAAWLVVPTAIWLLLFTVAPLMFTVAMSFWKSSIFGTTPTWNVDNYAKFFSDRLYISVLLTTLKIAALTTLICLAITYPVAWFLAQLRPLQKVLCLVAVFLPFWVSYIIRTFIWLPILGRNGVINNTLGALGVVDRPVDWLLYSEVAVYVGLAYVYLLYMLLPIFLSIDRLDRRLLEASQDLGASAFKTFIRVVVPLTWPGVLSGMVMVFLLSCGAFVTPQLLGGPSAIMFGNLIADQFIVANNWAFGATLSLVFIVVVLATLLVVGRRFGLQRVFLEST